MAYRWHAVVFASLLAAAAPSAFDAQAQTTLRLVSGWTPNNPNVPYIETVFIKNVEAASKGQIKIERRGPEVVPAFEQLQPVSAGVFDILFTTPGYHQAQTGVGNMFDAFKGDIEQRRSSGLVPKADEYYRRQYGLSLFALHAAPGNHFVLKEGLSSDGTLKGMKVRANPIFEGVVRALGGTPVNMPPSDAYSAMQKGVLDGITFPAFASVDYKLYEVGKVMTRPIFGLSNVAFFFNVRKFELPACRAPEDPAGRGAQDRGHRPGRPRQGGRGRRDQDEGARRQDRQLRRRLGAQAELSVQRGNPRLRQQVLAQGSRRAVGPGQNQEHAQRVDCTSCDAATRPPA